MKITVEHEGITYHGELEAYVVEPILQVGNSVSVKTGRVDALRGPKAGWVGKIVVVFTNQVGVEFTEAFEGGHPLGGKSAEGYGWWYFHHETGRAYPYVGERITDLALISEGG